MLHPTGLAQNNHTADKLFLWAEKQSDSDISSLIPYIPLVIITQE